MQQTYQSGRKHPNKLTIDIRNGSPPHKEIDTRWVEIKFTHSFSPRSYFATCIKDDRVYLHGGFSSENGIMNDMYICNLAEQSGSWKTVKARNENQYSPGPLRGHTMTAYKNSIILVGGQSSVVSNSSKIYRYDLVNDTWCLCKCTDRKGKDLNLALDSHSSLLYKDDLYVVGGYESNQTNYLQNILRISLVKLQQNELTFQIINIQGKQPIPRGNASCCLFQNQIYLFGGANTDDVFGDFWLWNITNKQWQQILPTDHICWPQKRKGATLVLHQQSNCLFLFGGIRKITKQQNDVTVFSLTRKRWVRIHSSTNQLYDPSPTIKQMDQSPTIAQHKRMRERAKLSLGRSKVHGAFKLGLHSVTQTNEHSPTKEQFTKGQSYRSPIETDGNFKRKISLVQQKKYRDFLIRKKKILTSIESGYDRLPLRSKNRVRSPTSQALVFSLNCMGEQPDSAKDTMSLPKVIYDSTKGQVIGKKPCARDGHAGLVYKESMIIIGGDRHMVSFNDAYLFMLDKGFESLAHYQ